MIIKMSMLTSAVFQLIILSFVPFVWWLIIARKKANFFKWVGLKKIKVDNIKIYLVKMVVFICVFSLISSKVFHIVIGNVSTATTQFNGRGVTAVPNAIIFAFFQTGLSEEIFFREFLGKRLINKFGFIVGNTMQAFVFALVHGGLFFPMIGASGAVVLTMLIGLIGWGEGFFDERKSGGSIVTSWIIHGIMNLISSVAII